MTRRAAGHSRDRGPQRARMGWLAIPRRNVPPARSSVNRRGRLQKSYACSPAANATKGYARRRNCSAR